MGIIYVGSADAIMYKGNQRINKIYRGSTLAYNRTYSAPTINSISSDSTSITFTITNNADESATVVYEQGDATPDASNVVLAAGATSSNITLSGLDASTSYTVYARADSGTGATSSGVASTSISTGAPPAPTSVSLSMSGYIVSYINQPSRAFDGNFSVPGGSFAASMSGGNHNGSILNMTFNSAFKLSRVGIQTGYTKISEMTLYYDTSNGSGTGWTSVGAQAKTSGHSNFQTLGGRTWWQPNWSNTTHKYTHWKLQATADSGAWSNEYWQELYLADSGENTTFGAH